MEKYSILSNPRHGWCNFTLNDNYSHEFFCTPSYIQDVMFDILTACKNFLQHGTSAVELDCEEKTYICVLTEYAVFIIDENDCDEIDAYAKTYILNVSGVEFCERILSDYESNTDVWIDFANLEYIVEEKEKYHKKEEQILNQLVKDVHSALKEKKERRFL